MNALVLLSIALRAIGRNKVRASLTMLGVVIGVGSVIAMVAIGRGATSQVNKQVAAMGQNMLTITPGSSAPGAVSMGHGTSSTLTSKDAVTIARECPSAVAVAVVVRTRGQVIYGSVNWAPMTVQGCDPAFLAVRGWAVETGEPFSEQDVRLSAQVCVIGATVARQVFGEEDPVGKHIRLRGMPLRILGVLEKKGTNSFGSDQDDIVMVPWTTVKKKLQGSSFDTVDQILIGAASDKTMARLEKEVTECLRVAHRKRIDGARGEDDFTVRSSTEMITMLTATTSVMTSLLAAIASISLIVGGIGIMNTMLVSVSERTREIGLRMALGARGIDILLQFLVEAATLSLMGGAIGLAAGAVSALLVAKYAKWPTLLSPDIAAIAIVFSAGVGIFFGLYPAWRASRLDPIEALRHE